MSPLHRWLTSVGLAQASPNYTVNLAWPKHGTRELQWLQCFKMVFLKILNVPKEMVFAEKVTYITQSSPSFESVIHIKPHTLLYIKSSALLFMYSHIKLLLKWKEQLIQQYPNPLRLSSINSIATPTNDTDYGCHINLVEIFYPIIWVQITAHHTTSY